MAIGVSIFPAASTQTVPTWTLTPHRDTDGRVETLQTLDVGTLRDRLTAVAQLIDSRLHPAATLVYGSAASGRLDAQSDLDIGVLLGRREMIDWQTLGKRRTDLEAFAQCAGDLVILDTASPILSMEVLRNHRVLSMPRPEAFHDFFARTLTDYFDLKRIRRPIEEALLKRRSS